MKTKLTGLLLLLASVQAYAQTGSRSPINACIASGAYSIKHTDIFSLTANPAALAQLNKPAAGMAADRRFLLTELMEYTLAVAVKSNSGNFGCIARYAGNADYNQTQTGIVYGRKLGNRADAGVAFQYNTVRMSSGYGAASYISAEAGVIAHLTSQLHAGIHISSPAGGRFGKDEGERVAPVYSLGLGYEASEKFLFSAVIEKEEKEQVNVNAGIQYRPVPLLQVRVGVSSATTSCWMGVGINYSVLRLDIISVYHPQLGITPGMSVLFKFKHEKK